LEKGYDVTFFQVEHGLIRIIFLDEKNILDPAKMNPDYVEQYNKY